MIAYVLDKMRRYYILTHDGPLTARGGHAIPALPGTVGVTSSHMFFSLVPYVSILNYGKENKNT